MTRLLDILAGVVTCLIAVGLYVLAIQLFWPPEKPLEQVQEQWSRDVGGGRIYATSNLGYHTVDWAVMGKPERCGFTLEQSSDVAHWHDTIGVIDCRHSGMLSFNNYGTYVRVKVSPFSGDIDSGVRFSIDGKTTDAR